MLLSNRTSGDLISLRAKCETLEREFENLKFFPCITVEPLKYKQLFVVIVNEDDKIKEFFVGDTVDKVVDELMKFTKTLRKGDEDVRKN